MAGICGAIETRSSAKEAGLSLCEHLNTRCPGTLDSWSGRSAFFAQTSLNCFDYEGSGPITRNDCIAVGDVRLDNRDDLKSRLGLDSELDDLELVVAAFERWGRDTPAHLFGDFAFAIWNQSKQQLFCARDPMGVRPLYYSADHERIVFASDINVVLAHSAVDSELNLELIATYLCNQYYPKRESTFFKEVKKLGPAQALTWSEGQLKKWRFWDPREISIIKLNKARDYAEAMRELLERAVTARLNTSAQIGAHLSGGLDSSSVAVLANRFLRERGRHCIAFSWSPPFEPGHIPDDERRRVVELAKLENMPLHFLCRWLDEHLMHLIRNPGREPINMTQFEENVQREAQSHQVRLMLSGWGGDEFFSHVGKGCLAEMLLRGKARRFVSELLKTSKRSNVGIWTVLKERVIKILLPEPITRALYSRPAHYAHPKLLQNTKPKELYPRHRPGVIQNMLEKYNLGHISDRMESWAASGANSGIVYAYPLLDRSLVEFCLATPYHFYHRDGCSRYIARLALQDILPPELTWGFPKRESAVFTVRKRSKCDHPIGTVLRAVQQKADQPQELVNVQAVLEDWGRGGNLHSRAVSCLFLE